MLLGGYLQWWFPSRCRHRFRTILIVPSTPNICMKATTQSIDAAGESILLRYAMMIFFDGGHIAGIATVAQTFHARPPDTEILLLKLRRTIIWFSSSWSSSRIPHGWFYVDNAAAENENGNVGHSRSGSNVTITQQSPRVLQKSTSVNSAYRWLVGVIDYLWLYARYSRYWGCYICMVTYVWLSTYDEMDRDVAFHHHTPPFTSWQIHFCKLPVNHISARQFLSQTYPLLMPKFIRLTCSWTNHWSREAVLTQDTYDKVRMGGWACIRRSTYYVDTPHNPWQPARKWLHPCHTNHGRPSKNFPMKGSVQESEIPLICYVQYSLFCPCISYGCIMLDYAQHSPRLFCRLAWK